MQNNLHYIIREPLVSIENPPVLFMLHGYGSNEQDLFSFAPQLPKELLIVSAQAPLSMGFGSYAWFEINFEESIGLRSNLQQAKQALSLVENLVLDITNKYQVNKDKMFMLGFSQGSFLSYYYAFNNPEIIKKFICLSGYLREEIINKNKIDLFTELDFFVSHGTQDQIIPIALAREIPVILKKYKTKYLYKEYPIGHGVSLENFNDFNHWIKQRI